MFTMSSRTKLPSIMLILAALLFLPLLSCSPLPSPLYITSLLSSGRHLEAQYKSHVTNFIPGVPESGYSAFFTIDEERGIHLHFWFIPRENCANWRQEPTLLWLQGGFGLSTLRSALQENVFPFNASTDGILRKSDAGLTQYANVLMLDNTNTGFSHTQDPSYLVDGYEMIADELYAGLTQFFLLFPDLKRSIYIGGVSAGANKEIYLAELILKRNLSVVDLSGVVIGDGVIDLETDMATMGQYLYNLGMLEKSFARNLTSTIEEMHAFLAAKDFKKAMNSYQQGLATEVNKQIGFQDGNLQDVMHAFRFRDYWLDYAQSDSSRDKLHVGSLPFVLRNPLYGLFLINSIPTVKARIEFILNKRVPFLKFQGQYDGSINYPGSVASLRSLDWYGQACLYSDQWRRSQVWFDGTLFGYLRQCRTLWEALALRASHVVQLYAPRPLWALVDSFVRHNENKS